MADPFILSLRESRHSSLVGGKAAGLSKLLEAGVAVPDGLCVTTALYHHCLDQARVDAVSLWTKLRQLSGEQRVQEQARIQQLIAQQPWPSGFQAELEMRLATLAGDVTTLWAVRSSATNEDAAGMSAAGLYCTTLGVSLAAVLRNQESLDSFDKDEERFEVERNRLGGVLLLKGKDNISSSNELYAQKLKSYANTLYWNETLRADTYHSKLDFRDFIKEQQLGVKFLDKFGPEELEERQRLLFELSGLIWSAPRLSAA